MENIKRISINKKILAIVLILITLVSNISPVFASSGTGKWVGGQYGSKIFTTDSSNSGNGVLIRRLVNYTTGEKLTVFCAEHGVEFDTGTVYNGEYYTPTNSTIKKACKIAYFGWYSKYGDYVVDGGILASDMKYVKQDYVFTQQMIWETLGQSSATFVDSSIQNQYLSFKDEINNKINDMQKRPSFDATTIEIDAGETKVLTDTNGVLADYASIDNTKDNVRFQHNKGENTLTITVSEDCTQESVKVSDSTMLSWGMVKDESKDNDTTVYFEFKDGIQNQLYAMHYNDPVTMELSLKINSLGNLELSKLNTNGDLVDGAVFNVTGPNDYNKDVTVKNGKITLEKLKKGDYLIKEKSSPTGYLLNTETYKVTIKANETTKQAIVNDEPTGSITVTKTNSNGDMVQGAKFTITASEDIYNKAKTVKYYTKGDTVATIITDSTGVANKTGLPLGKYAVQEIEVPTGYLLNNETKTVTLKYKDQNTKVVYENVTVKNDEPTGELSLIKVDVDTGNDERVDGTYHHGDASIKGAVYTLYANEDIYNVAKTVKYFSKNDAIATFTFDEKGNASVKIINSNTKAKIEVSGNKITGLPMGSYYAKETTVPEGYTQDTNVYKHTFTYKDSKTKVITLSGTVSNKVDEAPFEVIKVTTNDNTIAGYVEGAEFTAILTKYVDFYGSFDEALKHLDEYAKDEYSIFKTGSDGHGVSGLLAYGDYTVNETYTPSSQIETVEEFYVTIDKDSKTPIKEMVANDLPFEAYIKIVKQDKKTGKQVTFSNTTFSLYKLNENNEWERVNCKVGKEYHDTWTTDSDGIARTETKLESGHYKVDEIVIPTGFLQLDEELTFDVNNKNKTLNYDKDLDAWITVIAKNEQPTGTLVIDKSVVLKENVDTSLVDASDLSKIKFKLVAKENIIDMADGSVIYEKGTEIGEYNLSKDGDLTVSDLPMGTYEFYEIETLPGLVLDQTKYEVKFTAEDTKTKVYTDTRKVINDTTYVEISKQDIAGEEIEGAKLQVIDEKGNIIDEWTSTKTPHTIEGLLVDKTYTLHEEISADGYVKASDIQFTVNNTKETQKVTMIDKIVTMTKTDIGGTEIEGAQMTVTNENGEIVDSWTSTKEPHHISNLEENKKYVLHEVYAPDSYVVATDVEFLVTDSKETQEIVLIDKTVEMSKKDISGNEIEGAKLQVIDKDGKVIDEWTSTKESHQIKGLTEGETYTLHEEVCVNEYVKATDVEFTVTTDKETQKITMIDKIVEITKTDLTTGEELEGAELEVIDKDTGETVDKWTSTKEPHKVTGLEEGKTYILRETTAPYGYEMTEEIEFTVSTDKETQKVEMKDMPILKSVRVEKLDKDTKEHIKSNKFVFGIYEDAECTKLIKKSGANEDEGTALFDDLRYGTYYIKEIKAPTGYKLSDQIVKIEINENGVFADGVSLDEKDGVYSFEYYNSLLPKIQTGNETNYILLGSLVLISLIGIIGGITLLRKKHNEK